MPIGFVRTHMGIPFEQCWYCGTIQIHSKPFGESNTVHSYFTIQNHSEWFQMVRQLV